MGLDVFDNYECDGQLSLFEKPKDDSAKTNSFTPAKVHFLFEQSGTFKNQFINLGIPAEDYDIQDDFGQTDHVIDLFEQINNAYDGKPSIFDNMKSN